MVRKFFSIFYLFHHVNSFMTMSSTKPYSVSLNGLHVMKLLQSALHNQIESPLDVILCRHYNNRFDELDPLNDQNEYKGWYTHRKDCYPTLHWIFEHRENEKVICIHGLKLCKVQETPEYMGSLKDICFSANIDYDNVINHTEIETIEKCIKKTVD